MLFREDNIVLIFVIIIYLAFLFFLRDIDIFKHNKKTVVERSDDVFIHKFSR